MLDVDQLRKCVISPCLKKVNLYSKNAEELLVATVAHESNGGRYIIQNSNKGIFKKGALGVYQMETATHDDIWNNYLNYRAPLKEDVMTACNFKELPISYQLVWNLQYSTIMARLHYLRVKEKLPNSKNIEKIWEYYKKHWNTALGRAEKGKFIVNYLTFVGEGHENHKNTRCAESAVGKEKQVSSDI